MQTDQWGRQKGAVGLVKPGQGVQRDFLEEGVNEVAQRMADPGRRIGTTSGREERLVPLLGGVSRWVGPLQRRTGEAAECSSPVWTGAWGGIRSHASAPGALLLPSTALLCFSVSPGLVGDLPFVAAAVGGSRSPTKPVSSGEEM